MRTAGLTLSLTNLGNGSLSLDPPPEALAPREGRIDAPPSTRAENCRFLDGIVRPRDGYVVFNNKPASNVVNTIEPSSSSANQMGATCGRPSSRVVASLPVCGGTAARTARASAAVIA